MDQSGDLVDNSEVETPILPESSTTRPNPFHEHDDLSRKRRRTSASASQSPPADAHATDDVSHSSPPDINTMNDTTLQLTEPSDVKSATATGADESGMQTPLPRAASVGPDSASKLTLSLRRMVDDSLEGYNKAPSQQGEPTSRSSSREGSDRQIHRSGQESTPENDRDMSIGQDDNEEEDSDDTSASDMQEVITPPESFPFRRSEEGLLESMMRLTRYFSTERNIEIARLNMLSIWIQSTIEFLQMADRSLHLLTLDSQTKFWLAFPAIISAITTQRSHTSENDAYLSAVKGIIDLYSQLTAELVKFDHTTLQLVLADDAISGKEVALLSLEYLYIWYDIMYIEEQEQNGHGQPSNLAFWTRDNMAAILLKPLSESGGSPTQWLDGFLCSLAKFAVAKKARIMEFAHVSSIFGDCLKETHQQQLRALEQDMPTTAAVAVMDQSRNTWILISGAFATLVEKNASLLSDEITNRLIRVMASMLCMLVQASHEQNGEPDGIQSILEKDRLKYPDITPEVLLRAMPWRWRLDILTKLIRSGPMHLRVMAVNTLCTGLSDIWAHEGGQRNDDRSFQFIQHLGDVLDAELVDYIVGPSCHPEIIVGSANIIGFLILSGTRTAGVIDKLWHSVQSSQDPRVADAITRVIATAVSIFEYQDLVHLCEKFQQLPVGDFSQMMRNLWETVIREMATKAQLNNQPLTAHPYLSTLRVLRDIPTTDNGSRYVYPELHIAAMQRTRELLAYGMESDVRQELYRDCVNDLKSKSTTTIGSLVFISMSIRPAISSELLYLTETHDIVRLAVEELESAMDSAAQKSSFVIFGYANQPRRDLISQIIHFQPKSISETLGGRLWDVLVSSKSLNAEDRSAAWETISTVGSNCGYQNPFLQLCFSKHLPRLPADGFCEGMLNFVRENVLLLVNGSTEFNLDDEEVVSNSGIEHLWRIILLAHDDAIAKSATVLLVSAVYLDSAAMTSLPLHTAQNIHLRLVHRCLKLMREAGAELQGDVVHEGFDGDAEGVSSAMPTTQNTKSQTRREFTRTLRLLICFLEAYRTKPRYAIPDLRSLIPASSGELKGELVELRVQAFDGAAEGGVKPLHIGKENSVASLLATLREESGFKTFKAYYRGQRFIPTEIDVQKSIEDLNMCEGLILVKSDDTPKSDMPSHIKPGCSAVDIDLLSHFDELWTYLGLDASISAEVYEFLLKIPVDGELKGRLDSDTTPYEDLFASDQPFKSLYIVFALMEGVKDVRLQCELVDPCPPQQELAHVQALTRAASLLSKALGDASLVRTSPPHTQTAVLSSIARNLRDLLNDISNIRRENPAEFQDIPKPSAPRLISLLDIATSSQAEDSTQLAAHCISLLLKLGHIGYDFWLATANHSLFPQLLNRICILSENQRFRSFGISAIEDVVNQEIETPQHNGRIAKYIWKWALENLESASRMGENCHELMKLIFVLIKRMHAAYPNSIDLKALSHLLSGYLAKHTSTEDIEQMGRYDVAANGLANLLHLCMQIDTSLAPSLPSDDVWVFLRKHLFPEEQNAVEGRLPKIILNTDTRNKLYECVFLYLRGDKKKLDGVMQFLGEMVPFYAEDDHPYIYELPLQFDQTKALRSDAGYVGLQNLSNTCYLNSLMTQLYMNADFRKYLLSFPVREDDSSMALLHQTQKLFGYLEQSIRRAVEPSALVSTIKTYEQEPIDIHNQMDVDEFYNLLFDRWEAQLPNTVSKRKFRSFYGGQLVQQIKSKECDHISEKLEAFSAIQCDIKGKSTLQDSLKAYVGGEIMEGDNKYKCSSCDRHVDAVKRTCLKDIPDNLIFHLKRFDFNLQTLQRSKIDDYFAFPEKLNMHPYTIERLDGSSPADEDDMFELVGVLVHSGTAESGHYYSYIRERPVGRQVLSKWVEFNDDAVGIWDPKFMEDSTFGGPDQSSLYETNGIAFNKSYSAYMLFYQRTSSLREGVPPSAKSDPEVSVSSTYGNALKQHIQLENILLLRRHCLFDQNHGKFVQGCVYESLRQERDVHELNELLQSDMGSAEEIANAAELSRARELAMETALSYQDQIFSRSKDATHAVQFGNMLAELAKTQEDCAWNALNYFLSRPAVLRALLQRNPERGIRCTTSHLFVASMEKLSKACPQLYYPSAASSSPEDDDEMGDGDISEEKILPRLVKLLDFLWRYFHNHIRAWDEHFTTILNVAQLGREECAHILAADYLHKSLSIISADRSSELGPNYARMLQNVYKRFGTQPPSYTRVLAVIDYLMSQLEPEISNDAIVELADDRLLYVDGYFPWTSDEVAMLLSHPEPGYSSLFVSRLLEIDQAPNISRRILERILRAGELPTAAVFGLLEKVIRGDATTAPLDSYIRAASICVGRCALLPAAEHLIEHICKQAACFQNSEGETFLEFIQQALESGRASEEERSALRISTMRTIPRWAPYMLQYPDSRVRQRTEELVDMAVCAPAEQDGASSTEATQLSSELGMAIGISCLNFLQEAHIQRRAPIERSLASVLLRVVSNCSLVITTSEQLDDDAKEQFTDLQEDVVGNIARLMVDRVEDDASDWEGSAMTSDQMDEDAETEEALAMLTSGAYP